MKKTILIVSFSEISKDPRVKRQISVLNDRYDVVVFGYGSPPSEKCKFHSIPSKNMGIIKKLFIRFLMIFRAYESAYWINDAVKYFYNNSRFEKFDIIIANDLSSVPVAIEISQGRPIHGDLHEFSPREFEERFLWRISVKGYYNYICKKYLNELASITTVCQGIADAYSNFYKNNIEVTYNSPRYRDINPSRTDPSVIKLVHHGAALRSRQLENMVKLMDFLDEKFVLTFMLVPSDVAYFKFLKSLSKKNKRIKFVDPVSTDEICNALSIYDIGVYFLKPNNFNNEFSLPNKFFEFIQARLCLATGPSVEMKYFIDKYGVGSTCDDFTVQSFADMLNSLSTEDIDMCKLASHNVAYELSFDAQASTFSKKIDDLAA